MNDDTAAPIESQEPRLGLASMTLDQAPARGGRPVAVANALREGILDGALAPGTWLREAEVARELKVSRTPVRDSFRILEAEGLVEIKANQGVVVSAMTSDDVLELYVVRESLEAIAARLAARHGSYECLKQFQTLIPQMREAAEAGKVRELSRLNFRFHEVIVESAGNRYLSRFLTRIQQAARRFPDPTLSLPGRVDESIAEHVAIADAISRGAVDEAERLSSEHMRHLAELRIQQLLRT
jgi:DNA-binding GntR family transcriptional regulator